MGLPASTSTLPIDAIRFATDRLSTKLKVFVAGPEIQKTWTGHDWRKKAPSALLRLRVHQHLEALAHESVLGEHKLVASMAATTIPDTPSVVVTETYVVATSCSGVILIPDSPGSFCELASWTQSEELASKMLILANKKYEHQTSYINPGVFSIAIDNYAQLAWVDYRNWRSVRPAVDRFIDSRQQKLFRRDLFSGKLNKR